MNLVDCSVSNAVIDRGGVQLPIPSALVDRATRAKNHVFGIRPENVALHQSEGAEDIAVPAKVVISEPLGAETLVTFAVGKVELVARCPASFRVQPETVQTLYLRPSAMHLFDKNSGQAL
jgi:multiple sugar transport system ATP-binding protein